MFQGRKYVQQGGYKGWAVRFADNLSAPGVATTSYSFAMSDKERYEMARRITAALNLTSKYTIDQIEAMCVAQAARDAGKIQSSD
ncbi:hypothetical protein V0M98_34720 (plasmid) [Pseudomonas silesiensis]|uniref:hypothetical protein n=1 Tax=Pseudomonas silesiensis TaxID=1853130 RepID=UPI0030CBEDBB